MARTHIKIVIPNFESLFGKEFKSIKTPRVEAARLNELKLSEFIQKITVVESSPGTSLALYLTNKITALWQRHN